MTRDKLRSAKHPGVVELGSDGSAAEDIRRAPQQEDAVDLDDVTLGKVLVRYRKNKWIRDMV